MTSISSPLLEKIEEPQRGQKKHPALSRVSPVIVTAFSRKIADAWNKAP